MKSEFVFLLLRTIIGLLLPPCLMIFFCITEGESYPDKPAMQFGLGMLFIVSLVPNIALLFKVFRTVRPEYSIVLSILLGSGPFWGAIINVAPNIHGVSILLFFLYVVTAWSFSAWFLGIAIWRLLKRKTGNLNNS